MLTTFDFKTWSWEKSFFLWSIKPPSEIASRFMMKTKLKEVYSLIEKESDSDESIAVLVDRFGGMEITPRYQRVPANVFNAYTGRPALNRGVPEYLFYGPIEYQKARILITSKPFELANNSSFRFLEAYNVFPNETLYIYRNSAEAVYKKKKQIKPFITLSTAFVCIVILLGIVIYDFSRQRKIIRADNGENP